MAPVSGPTSCDQERARFSHHTLGQMMWFDNLHYQYRQGFIESLDVGVLPKTFAQDVERILSSA